MEYGLLTEGLVLGGLGGVIRGFLGIKKSVSELRTKRSVEPAPTSIENGTAPSTKYLVNVAEVFELKYFLYTIVVSSAIGGCTAMIAGTNDPKTLVLAGYAGIDAFESLVRKK